MVSGESGEKLAQVIKNAIRDLEITNAEYDRIMATAEADGVIDEQERALLGQLQQMIIDGTVKRVPE